MSILQTIIYFISLCFRFLLSFQSSSRRKDENQIITICHGYGMANIFVRKQPFRFISSWRLDDLYSDCIDIVCTHIKCIHLRLNQSKKMCKKNYSEGNASISNLCSANDEEVDVNYLNFSSNGFVFCLFRSSKITTHPIVVHKRFRAI